MAKKRLIYTFANKPSYIIGLCLLGTLLLISPIYLAGQDLSYARAVVDTLSAPSMHGRAYVRDGDRLAARYISREFKRWGLELLGLDYYQPFRVNAMVYPSCMDVTLGKRYLLPGIDYQVTPGSGSIEGKYKIRRISERDLLQSKRYDRLMQQHFQGQVVQLCYRQQYADSLRNRLSDFKQRAKAAAYIVPAFDKLTWHISTKPLYYSEIQLKSTYFAQTNSDIQLKIDAEYLQNYETRNVVGYISGAVVPDSFVVFTAHYDHLGRMGGDVYIPGANDNASGIAMLLNLAKHYSQHKPYYTVLFIAFSGEELGLLGSKHYVHNAPFDLKKIKFLVNTDIVGTGNEGITVVNATEFPHQFQHLQQINQRQQYLPLIKQRGKAANSDHHWFYERQVPCFFIYTMGGIKAYHDIYDRAGTLPLSHFVPLCRLLIDFADGLAPRDE